jgi:hypothetical protein
VDSGVDRGADDGVSLETELSCGSPSSPSTRATRAPSAIVSATGLQLRFRYPSAYLFTLPGAHSAITVPPPSMPRNKAAIAPAAKSPTMAVDVWWQHIVVVAIEVDVIDQEVYIVEIKVGVDFEGIGFEEVDLIDQEVDVVENKVGVDFEGIGFEEVDIKFKGFEIEEIDIEDEGVFGKDEFRLIGDIQEDREVA